MSHLINRYILSLPKLIISGLFLIIISTIILAGVTNAGNVEGTTEGRLITIHDRGLEKVIVSQAETIGDALKQAGISIDENDAVEPAVDEKLIASDYQVNIYRARPVTVIDGSIRQKIVTPYQTAEQIVKDAGIFLYAEDKMTLGLSNNLIDGAGLELVITRSVPVVFTVYGKTSEVRTLGKNVADLLKEKNITISTTDRLSVTLDTSISEGMALRLWREGKQTVTIEEAVDFDVDKIEDLDQPVGYLLVKTKGEAGTKNVTYEISIQDDKEINRTAIATIITKQPKKQIETVGARGQYTTPVENESIAWDFFIANGFSRVQTAGIMGNLMQEHRFRTSGDGIAQWNGSRKAKLYSMPYPNNIYTQLQFLMDELNGGYYRVRDAIKANTDSSPAGVVRIFQNDFERCNPTYCREDLRIQYAFDILASH